VAARIAENLCATGEVCTSGIGLATYVNDIPVKDDVV
jgi:hypothetical protein